MSVKSILMVCRGNICRSPMAEGFFKQRIQLCHSSISVSSAGISALVDHSADPHAEATMQQHGIDISAHKARQLTEEMVRKSDLIFVMTLSHLNTLTREFRTSKGKTFLLTHWQNCEIHDPYLKEKGAFENVYQQIELAWQEWQTRIMACPTYV